VSKSKDCASELYVLIGSTKQLYHKQKQQSNIDDG
jgi:hypothetical protein